MCACILEMVLWVIVAHSKLTYLISNAELFSILKVDWRKGQCASHAHLFLFLLLLAHVVNLLGSPHPQPNKEVKKSNNTGEPLFTGVYQQKALLKLSRQFGSLAPFGEKGFVGMCHGDLLQVEKNFCFLLPCFAEIVLKTSKS